MGGGMSQLFIIKKIFRHANNHVNSFKVKFPHSGPTKNNKIWPVSLPQNTPRTQTQKQSLKNRFQLTAEKYNPSKPYPRFCIHRRDIRLEENLEHSQLFNGLDRHQPVAPRLAILASGVPRSQARLGVNELKASAPVLTKASRTSGSSGYVVLT